MTASRQVIVVEDDRDFRESMVEYLMLCGLEVVGVESALEFYQSISQQKYALVIIDIGLPDQNGIVLAEYVRNNTAMRIIMLTAQSSLESKVLAYQAGADMFLVKPIDFSELSASIHSILGRLDENLSMGQTLKKAVPTMEVKLTEWALRSDWVLSTPKGDEIKLTSKEYDLIHRLALSPESVITRQDLLIALDYEDNEHGNRSLDALVHRLRRKKISLKYGIPIKTAHSKGYVFSAPIHLV